MSLKSDVRNYLLYLDSPEEFQDHEAVAAAERKVAATTDPLDKVFALEELKQAREVNVDSLERAFVRSARRYGEHYGIAKLTFVDAGVSARVVNEAWDYKPSTVNRVNREDLIKEALSVTFGERITATELRERIGGSQSTSRRVLQELADEGEYENVGKDPNWEGNVGHNPDVYVRRSRQYQMTA